MHENAQVKVKVKGVKEKDRGKEEANKEAKEAKREANQWEDKTEKGKAKAMGKMEREVKAKAQYGTQDPSMDGAGDVEEHISKETALTDGPTVWENGQEKRNI